MSVDGAQDTLEAIGSAAAVAAVAGDKGTRDCVAGGAAEAARLTAPGAERAPPRPLHAPAVQIPRLLVGRRSIAPGRGESRRACVCSDIPGFAHERLARPWRQRNTEVFSSLSPYAPRPQGGDTGPRQREVNASNGTTLRKGQHPWHVRRHLLFSRGGSPCFRHLRTGRVCDHRVGQCRAATCKNGVPNGATVDVVLIVQAVHNALRGCSR